MGYKIRRKREMTLLMYTVQFVLVIYSQFGLVNTSKCTYSFVVNEVDPDNCPCLTESNINGNTRTWLPPSPHGDSWQADGTKTNVDVTSFHQQQQQHDAVADDVKTLQTDVTELQQQYQTMYNKLKDLEVRFYKDTAHYLHLQTQTAKQEQTLKDYRFITERLKADLDDTQWTVDKEKLRVETQLGILQTRLDVNTETLRKHSDYLQNIHQQGKQLCLCGCTQNVCFIYILQDYTQG